MSFLANLFGNKQKVGEGDITDQTVAIARMFSEYLNAKLRALQETVAEQGLSDDDDVPAPEDDSFIYD